MMDLLGYHNTKRENPIPIRDVKVDFQPNIEYGGNCFSLFMYENEMKKKKDILFENSKILCVIHGNLYFKKGFCDRYSKHMASRNSGAAEMIADLYQEYGTHIFHDLSGDFIIAVEEKASSKSILARDKMGGRKLYYTLLNGYIIFSSKIKKLLSVPGISRDIDYFALENFLKFGYVVAPKTIFKSIKELEPGHLIEISKDDHKIVPYWNLNPGDEIRRDRSQIRDMLYRNIGENISVRMNSKERIGIYLSGGIDSNTLLATLAKFRDPSEIATMSIGYGEQYKDYHELNQAKFSANYFGSTHYELINGPEHIDKYLCKTLWEFEQPFGNPALISWTALSELAKDLVDVVFIGAGADEVLGGYRRYNALSFLKVYYRIPYYSVINKILNFALGTLSLSANHYSPMYRLRKFFDSMHLDILKTNENFLFGQYDKLRKKILTPSLLNEESSKEPTLDKYYKMACKDDIFKKIFCADCYTDLISEQLTRALIPLNVFGIDYRAPFSDPEFMQMCLNIPDKYKMNLFETKIIYKEAVSGILPETIIKQKKRGMSHPVNLWFQGPLYESLNLILSSNNVVLREYFNIDYLRLVAAEHRMRKHDWGNLLWKMVVFSMWHKLFIENNPSSMPDFRMKDISLSE